MCGFVGYVQHPTAPPLADAGMALARAAETIRHRGPDDGDIWLDEGGRAGLGFRRLSILDLSEHGRQPMRSVDGRYVIAFNGEVYNHRDLRAKLDGEHQHHWRGHSDTEVLLEWVRRHGVASALEHIDGMFAFALWDQQAATLTLARDRFGEKPLYYGWSGNTFVFASELKAIRAMPGFEGDLDRDALALFFRYRYVPAPKSIYRAYRKLPAATVLCVADGQETARRYWDPADVAEAGAANPFGGTYQEALDELERLFQSATARRLESDVSLGAFLSGGIDSSLTVAHAQNAMGGGVNTFTVGFAEQHFNEAPFARRIAEHLGTHHTEIQVTEQDALDVVDQLPAMFDEPFADPSQLPTAVLCAQARRHVTVALAGDGGDELFCGYGRYLNQIARWRRVKQAGEGPRRRAALLARHLPVGLLDSIDGLRGKPGKLGRKWLAKLLERSTGEAEAFFMIASSFWRDGVPVRGVGRLEQALFMPEPMNLAELEDVRRFQALDARLYLPDDVLVKTDRASMAASLEVRTPFLNAELARFAWSLPFSWMDPDGAGLKSVLKDMLARHVPREWFERAKMGFDAPMRSWLRGELKAWGRDLVENPSPLAQQWLDTKRIRSRWHAHQKGMNAEGDLWPALVMLAWMRDQAGGQS